jgi:hypothetical protein
MGFTSYTADMCCPLLPALQPGVCPAAGLKLLLRAAAVAGSQRALSLLQSPCPSFAWACYWGASGRSYGAEGPAVHTLQQGQTLTMLAGSQLACRCSSSVVALGHRAGAGLAAMEVAKAARGARP